MKERRYKEDWQLALMLAALGTALVEFTRARKRYHRIRVTETGQEKLPKPDRRSRKRQ